ncbi:MAG: transposase [Clostridiales bacterium]|nr:transposase [Clostridiales bacterium]
MFRLRCPDGSACPKCGIKEYRTVNTTLYECKKNLYGR